MLRVDTTVSILTGLSEPCECRMPPTSVALVFRV